MANVFDVIDTLEGLFNNSWYLPIWNLLIVPFLVLLNWLRERKADK